MRTAAAHHVLTLFASRIRSDAASLRCAGLGDKLHGYETLKDFIASLEKPRSVLHSISEELEMGAGLPHGNI